MTIEERLARLERQNRILCRTLAGLLLLVLAVPLTAFMWQGKKPRDAEFRTVKADRIFARESITLVSLRAPYHISMTTDKEQAGLVISPRPGRRGPRTFLYLNKAGTHLELMSDRPTKGKVQVPPEITLSASKERGLFRVMTEGGRLLLAGRRASVPGLSIFKTEQEDDQKIISLRHTGEDSTHSGLWLFHKGKSQASLAVIDGGKKSRHPPQALLTFFDTKGTVVHEIPK